jgi:hypothetical protein
MTGSSRVTEVRPSPSFTRRFVSFSVLIEFDSCMSLLSKWLPLGIVLESRPFRVNEQDFRGV